MPAVSLTLQEKALIIDGKMPFINGSTIALQSQDVTYLRTKGFKLELIQLNRAGNTLYKIYHPTYVPITQADIAGLTTREPKTLQEKIDVTIDNLKKNVNAVIIEQGEKIRAPYEQAVEKIKDPETSKTAKYIAYGIFGLLVLLGSGYLLKQVRGIVK